MNVGPYKENGSGSVWLDPEEKDKVIKKIIDHNSVDDEVFGSISWHDKSFETEEMYVEQKRNVPCISIVGNIEELTISVDIPIRDTPEFRQLVKDIVEKAGIEDMFE